MSYMRDFDDGLAGRFVCKEVLVDRKNTKEEHLAMAEGPPTVNN
jgi:hypothetical protein